MFGILLSWKRKVRHRTAKLSFPPMECKKIENAFGVEGVLYSGVVYRIQMD